MTENRRSIVGIDLGTTNSLVSYIRDGVPRIIPNERGSRITPSVVSFKEDGRVLVGETAKNQAVLNGERTVSNVKLSMGKDRAYEIDGKRYTPVEISSLILEALKGYAERYLETEVREALITVPAYFDDRQRDDTLKAAELAGLQVRKLLNEPTAAALAHGFGKEEESRLLVLDLGGGTLDVTLMEYRNGVFKVRGVGGAPSLGGTDFDRVIVDCVLKDFESTYGLDLRRDPIAYQQLVLHAEKAKIDLSSASETRITIPYITVTEKGPIHLNAPFSRQALEALAAPILDEIRERMLLTFRQAGLDPDWVREVILVGGSTRLPAVEALVKEVVRPSRGGNGSGETLESLFPHGRLKREIHADEAVALGAGILGGVMEGSLAGVVFHDITAHDLGVEDDGSRFVGVLPRGSVYPVKVSRLFTTTRDYQEEVRIHVLQQVGMGEESFVSLGWFRLKMPGDKKKGEPSVDVTFSIDTNGILDVSAVDLDSGEAGEIRIEYEKFLSFGSGVFPEGSMKEKFPGDDALQSKDTEEVRKNG